jgi:rod shape-determining protein MreC
VGFKKHEKRSPNLLLVGIILLIWFLLPVGSKAFVKNFAFEFQAPAWTASSYIQDLQTYWALRLQSKESLVETIRDLARLNSAYELAVSKIEGLEQEKAGLETLLDLPIFESYRYEPARVRQRDMSAWCQQIILDKGHNYSIPIGAGVVFKGGVVGKVREVYAYTCIVELITSSSFRSIAHIAGDLRPITYYGAINNLGMNPEGRAEYISNDIKIQPGKPYRLVSSKLGGVFPDGLTVGYIKTIEPNPNGLFQTAQIKLDKDLLSLREVSILIPVNSNEL